MHGYISRIDNVTLWKPWTFRQSILSLQETFKFSCIKRYLRGKWDVRSLTKLTVIIHKWDKMASFNDATVL